MKIIYTDGSCLGNPGEGGWCFCLNSQNRDWIVSGGEEYTTNNRMELRAVIEGIRFANTKEIKIYTDSKYVINCAKDIWKKQKNKDMWKEYEIVSKNIKIEWTWVKGHSGEYYNELVDYHAREEAKNKKNK